MAAIVLTEKEQQLLAKTFIIVAVIIALVYGSEYYVTQSTAEERQLNNSLKSEEADYRRRLAEIQDEERLQNQYVESYLEYQEGGLIVGEDVVAVDDAGFSAAEERRIQLLERLQQIQQDRNLYQVEARLTRPESLPATFSEFTQDSNVEVRTNRMFVAMPMLHSLDMLMLLNDFYDAETNRFVPVDCKMQRSGEIRDLSTDELLVNEAKLHGECSLVWLTVFDPLQGRAEGIGS